MEDTRTPSDTPGVKSLPCQFLCAVFGKLFLRTLFTTIVSLCSGAMWALGLVVLLVTVAGVLALLVYVLKW